MYRLTYEPCEPWWAMEPAVVYAHDNPLDLLACIAKNGLHEFGAGETPTSLKYHVQAGDRVAVKLISLAKPAKLWAFRGYSHCARTWACKLAADIATKMIVSGMKVSGSEPLIAASVLIGHWKHIGVDGVVWNPDSPLSRTLSKVPAKQWLAVLNSHTESTLIVCKHKLKDVLDPGVPLKPISPIKVTRLADDWLVEHKGHKGTLSVHDLYRLAYGREYPVETIMKNHLLFMDEWHWKQLFDTGQVQVRWPMLHAPALQLTLYAEEDIVSMSWRFGIDKHSVWSCSYTHVEKMLSASKAKLPDQIVGACPGEPVSVVPGMKTVGPTGVDFFSSPNPKTPLWNKEDWTP